jgi:hypothetical protein
MEALGGKSGAKFRLHEIDVEEVSLVDRPANRHRFLVIKQEKESAMKIKLSEAVKKSLLETLAPPLAEFAALVSAVKDAEGTDEVIVPNEVHSNLLSVVKSLVGNAEMYPSDITADLVTLAKVSNLGSEAADKLKLIGAMIMHIAEAGSPDDVLAIASQALATAADKAAAPDIKELLSAFGASALVLSKSDGTLSEEEVAATASLVSKLLVFAQKSVSVEPVVEPVAEPVAEPVVEPVAEPVAAAAEPVAAAAEPEPTTKGGAKMSADNLAMLQRGIAQLQQLVDAVSGSLREPAVKAVVSAPAPVDNTSTDITKTLAALLERVEKLAKRPLPPSSVPEPTPAAPAAEPAARTRNTRRGGPWVWS